MSNLTQSEMLPSFNEKSKQSTGYQESLAKILFQLKEKSTAQELQLAELFNRIYAFERQVESLKVQLFRLPDIFGLDLNQLFMGLFRTISNG